MSEALGLAEVIEGLRRELEEAVDQAEDENIRFLLGDIEIELQTTVERSAGANAGIKFWVVDTGATGEHRRENVHTLRLALEAVDAAADRDDEGAQTETGKLKLRRRTKR